MPETRTPPALRRPARPRPALILALLLGVPLAACQGTPPDTQAQTAGPVYVASGKGRIDIEGGVIRLAAQRDGIIARVHAEEGERVQAGQRLAELDHETARRQLALAEAELGEARAALARVEVDWRAAQREVERLRSLADNDNVSAQERALARDRHDGALAALRVARAACESAAARRALAEREVEERFIVAPLAGQIVQRQARPGNGVSTLNVTPLFLFAPDGPRIARVEVEEQALPEIAVGQKVDVVLDADHRRRWDATVLRIGRMVGARTPSDDPTERQDHRVVEVVLVLSIDAPDALIGQRVVARFAARSGA